MKAEVDTVAKQLDQLKFKTEVRAASKALASATQQTEIAFRRFIKACGNIKLEENSEG